MVAFHEMAAALAEVHADKLYLDDYKTFEKYAAAEWGLSRSEAYRQLDAAKLLTALSPIGDSVQLPASESVYRALAPLKATPDVARDVYIEAFESIGGPPTAKVVSYFVKSYQDADAASARVGEVEIEPTPKDAVFTAVRESIAAARIDEDLTRLGAVAFNARRKLAQGGPAAIGTLTNATIRDQLKVIRSFCDAVEAEVTTREEAGEDHRKPTPSTPSEQHEQQLAADRERRAADKRRAEAELQEGARPAGKVAA